ncbi:hypothetical protein [Sneathiella aquimaris]|uniref:hypothetical protein n=1 Tax=Sneathiella aquimaris TaxID=2599305 RepID=UPI00146C3490|nr:hypothetical protein [Sneathiella aquimaris]
MAKILKKLVFVTVFLMLQGCQATTLLDLNKDYVTLAEQQAKNQHYSKDGVPYHEQELVTEAYGLELEQLALKALESADEAASDAKSASDAQERNSALRNEASFLNVSVRSYLSSGKVADHNVVSVANRGVDVCAGLKGLEGLPTTCGYFHIVKMVALNNELARKTRALLRKAALLNQGEKLTVEEGKILLGAHTGSVAAIVQLEKLRSGNTINWQEASKGLHDYLIDEQINLLCNAITYRGRILDAKAGDGWDPLTVLEETRPAFNEVREALKTEPQEFNRQTDCDRV